MFEKYIFWLGFGCLSIQYYSCTIHVLCNCAKSSELLISCLQLFGAGFLFIGVCTCKQQTNVSGDGSSLIERKTGHKEEPEDGYKGEPSVLKMKLILNLLCRNWPSLHNAM